MDYQANIFIWLSILGMVRSYILTTSFTCICMRKMSSWNLTTRQNFEFRTCVRQEVSVLAFRSDDSSSNPAGLQVLLCKKCLQRTQRQQETDTRKKRTKIIVKMQGMVHVRIFLILNIMRFLDYLILEI